MNNYHKQTGGRTTTIDFEEALRNIDIFCNSLVKKMIEENEQNSNNEVEPMEKLLKKKFVIEEHLESNPLENSLISLPQAEKPLIDVFGDDDHVRIFMQCRCNDQRVTIKTETDDMEVCKKECYTNEDGTEVCAENCQKLNIHTKYLQIENMTAKCKNNSVFEIDIPKANSDIST